MTLSEIFSAIYAERESPSYAVQWDDMHKRTSIFNIRVARGPNLRESTESGREHPSQAYSAGNEKAHSNSAEYKNGHDSMMNMLVKTQATTTVYDVNGPENRNRFPRTDCAAIEVYAPVFPPHCRPHGSALRRSVRTRTINYSSYSPYFDMTVHVIALQDSSCHGNSRTVTVGRASEQASAVS